MSRDPRYDILFEPAAIGPLMKALTAISDSLDASAQQEVSTYLTRVITAMANFAGADVSEHPS